MADARHRLAAALLALLALAPPLSALAADAPAAASTPAPAASVPESAASAPATVKFQAPTARLTAADPALEARMIAITRELRCLVCQNQTVADSHADLAADLRQEVRELLQKGRTPEQIRKYMTDRYGDFVLYRPPLKASTVVLWLGPVVLLATALAALVVVIRRRARLADDQFEPDPMLDDGLQPSRPGTSA